MRRAFIFAPAILLFSCQHYGPAPLAAVSPLQPSLSQLAISPAASPLTSNDVVRLALANNPDLRALRAKRGIADAQLLQAGLFPNPTLTGDFLPLISGVGEVSAWSVALGYDVKALVTYRSRRRGARNVAGQAAADLLWQEWLVAGQARQLTADLLGTRAQRPILEQLFQILSARNAATQHALARGDVTLVTAAPTLSALQTARTGRDMIDQRLLQLGHQLNALLGLTPDAQVTLTPTPELPVLDPSAVRQSLATLPQRRPDLLALRLGYAAQEETVRTAVLSQFPDLILGPQGTSDSSRVINIGPQIAVSVPIFDHAQGAIAIAKATRAQLRAEYNARLATITGEVGAALREIDQLSRQLDVAKRDLPAARVAADRAVAARGASAIDEAAFTALITTRFTKEQEVMALRLALLDRQIALQTLLGVGLPQVDTLPMVAPAGAAR